MTITFNKDQDNELLKVIINGTTEDGESIQAVAMLHYLQGNSAPYFSITGSSLNGSGCIHDEILKAFPNLKPLVDLHLSAMDGLPSHAVANGVYWIEEGNIKNVASHLRINDDQAKQMILDFKSVFNSEERKELEELKSLKHSKEWKTSEEEETDTYKKNMQRISELEASKEIATANAKIQIETMIPRFNKEAKNAIELLEELNKTTPEALPFHDQQALDFITDTETVISKKFSRCEPQKTRPELLSDIYEIIFARGSNVFTFEFYASHDNRGSALIKYMGKKHDPFKNSEGVKVGSREEAETMLKEMNRFNSRNGEKFEALTESQKRVYRMVTAISNSQVFFKTEPKHWITDIQRIEPSDYDIITVLQKYEVGSFEDFISDYGYELDETNYTETMKTYQAVCSEYNNLARMYSPSELKTMAEIQ